jgi:hypothetical protein
MKWIAAASPLLALSSGNAREMSTDRPDATESPFTVEPGIYQIESTAFSYSKEGSRGVWTLAESNFKTGLTDRSDLQLVLRPWIRESGAGEGFGDVDVRLKYNLTGNDDGKIAAALMPFVTIPSQTAVSTGEWQGGFIVPFAMDVGESLGVGFQIQIDRAWNEEDQTHDWDFLHTAVIGGSASHRIGWFLEYVGAAGDHPYQASLLGGITYATNPDWQWDFAVGVGLTHAADDFSLAQGLSFRF